MRVLFERALPALSGGRLRMGRSTNSITELCREHGIAESLLRKWRDQALEAAAERFESGQERSLQAEQRRRIRGLERTPGRKTYELEIAGEALRGWE
jgi:transposase